MKELLTPHYYCLPGKGKMDDGLVCYHLNKKGTENATGFARGVLLYHLQIILLHPLVERLP